MAEGKNWFAKNWGIFVVIAILVAFAFFAYYQGWLKFIGLVPDETKDEGATQVGNGTPVTYADVNCGNMRSSSARITEQCTRPLYQKAGSIKERGWTMESSDYPFDICVGSSDSGGHIKEPNGKTWYFNYQSGNRCIYIDSKQYPIPQN